MVLISSIIGGNLILLILGDLKTDLTIYRPLAQIKGLFFVPKSTQNVKSFQSHNSV